MRTRWLAPTLLRAWMLAALLLAAQAAGLAHRVAHAPGLPGAVQVKAGAWHEAGTADCRLIDQLAHADALCTPAPALPALPVVAEATQALPQRTLAAAAPAAYLARAPPRG